MKSQQLSLFDLLPTEEIDSAEPDKEECEKRKGWEYDDGSDTFIEWPDGLWRTEDGKVTRLDCDGSIWRGAGMEWERMAKNWPVKA